MSVTARQLRAVAERSPTGEKLLVAPGGETNQAAFTLLDRLAGEGTGWVGFRATTVGELAEEAAAPTLASGGLRRIPRTVQLFLVQELADRLLLGEEGGYFSGLPRGASLYRAVRDALQELRLAGLGAEDLGPEVLVSPEKARALRRLARAYESRLEEEGWADRAGLLRLALEAVRDGGVRPADVLLVPRGARLSTLEAELLRAWPAGERRLLGWPGDRGVEAGPGRAAARLDRFRPVDPGGDALPHRAGLLFRAGDLPPGATGEMELKLAVGAGNEVRWVLRRVLGEGIPLDRVEVAYTDDERYRSLLNAEAERFGLRCTFAEGLPVTLTRPGQALRLFHDWILEDHDDRLLRRMMRSGLVDFRRAAEGLSILPTQAAELLREAKVGAGRERYGEAPGRLEARIRGRLERREAAGEATDALRRRLELVGELRRLVDPDGGLLWEFVPRGREVPVGKVAARSLDFLERLADRRPSPGRRTATEDPPRGLEPAAHESLAEILERIARDVDQALPPRRAVRLLRDVVELHPVSRSGPRPGCLHAAPLDQAGLTGRPHLFVLGLDESSFPGSGLEDPVLLDRERAGLPALLPAKGREPSERLHDLARALGACDGRVTLTASVLDVADDRELYPGSAFLRAWRVASGDPEAGFEDCLHALSPPASFVPSSRGDGGEAPASPAEAWLARPDRGTEGYLERVREAHPPLARGREAERRRAGPAFTAWDGRVQPDPEELDPRRSGDVVSPSRLETLVESPFRYFLRYVLGVEAVEELSYEPGRWLTPLERGSLLHEVFHAFMEEVTARGERPDAERHRELMGRTTDRLLEAWRERLPPPTEGAFRREAREVRTTAGIFLRDEEDRADEAEPLGFEVRFGRRGGRRGEGELDSPDPVRLELGGAGALRLRGSIDRVDRLEDGGYRVWDYKTGSPAGYSRTDPLGDGRLQWLLYARCLEALLERAGREPRVPRSGYLFPGERGHGERISFPVDAAAAERMAAILARRLDLAAAGLFPHPPDADACRWCDVEAACGDAERRTEQARRKLEALRETAGGGGRGEGASRDGGDDAGGEPEGGPRGPGEAPRSAAAGQGATDPELGRLLRRWADG